jgi:hypothetical protein
MQLVRIAIALLVAIAVAIVASYATVIASVYWDEWLYPGPNSIDGIGGAILGLVVGPLCGLASGVAVLYWPNRKKPSEPR